MVKEHIKEILGGKVFMFVCPICGKENPYINKSQAEYNARAHIHSCKQKQRRLTND